MLFLLRQIRRKLMKENKIGTYLLYAIGEIILVVVGILIAVSIDDWNGDRKQKAVEKKYFFNLKNDLLADIEGLNYKLDLARGKVAASKRIGKLADEGNVGSLYEFANDMQDLIFVGEFTPNRNTYEEMLSSGNFSTLKNDSLKLKLRALDQKYIELEDLQEHMRYDFNVFLEDYEKFVDWSKYYDLGKSDITNLILVHDSTYIENNRRKMEQEVLTLFQNKVFPNNIFLLEINYTYDIYSLEETKTQIGEIIELLDVELSKN